MVTDVEMHRGMGLEGQGVGFGGALATMGRGRADSKDSVECWDDDPDFADIDDIPAPRRGAASPAFSRTSTDLSSIPDRRQSLCSSRMSIASTHDMEEMGDHELPLDDSPAAAIASAIRAGIPIPESVPPSALVGGTIKRLGNNKKGRRITAHDDWSEDLELPGSVNKLTVKRKEFSDAFDELMDGRRNGNHSPFKLNLLPSASSQLDKFRDDDDDDFMADFDDAPTLRISKDRFNNSNFGKPALPSPPLSVAASTGPRCFDDEFDKDFEFPVDGPLRLKANEGHNNHNSMGGGFDDWSEIDSGTGGSYYDGGSRRDGSANDDRMNPSHLMSPSMTAMTMESEDEMPMDGLVLPESGLPDLNEVMERRRRESETLILSPVKQEPVLHVRNDSDDVNDGFFDGIEIGDGEIFDTRKLTLNRNVKQKNSPRKRSPTRRTAMSLTFTTSSNSEKFNTPRASATRSHKVSQSQNILPSQLEPVAERENPPSTVKRRNRWSTGAGLTEPNHFSGKTEPSSTSNTSANPMSRLERQQSVGKKPSVRGSLKTENTAPTTTSAQLLRAKRSIPSMNKPGTTSQPKNTRQQPPPVPTRSNSTGINRPSSRTSAGRPPSATASTGRPPSSSANSSGRPTTNTGSRPPSSGGNVRPGSRSSQGRPPSRTDPPSAGTRSKTPANNRNSFQQRPPFNSGGSTATAKNSSNYAATKSSRRSLDRNDIERLEKRPTSRLQQRSGMTPRHSPSSSGASTATAKKSSPLVAPEHLRREAASAMTQPTRKRNFGDGTELEQFDDLPTNVKQENKFTVTPVGRGAPKCLQQGPTGTIRGKNLHARQESKDEPLKKKIDRTGRSRIDLKNDGVPSYLRDTAASRNAREITQQRLNMVATNTPLPTSPSADRWRTSIAARSNATPRASRRKPQTKPHLIKHMGNISALPKEAAATGMTYNPRTMQWDGNETALAAFDAPSDPPPSSTPALAAPLSPPTRAQPALITKVNTTSSAVVQVVGGMVFDPARMCWLKASDEDASSDEGDPFEGVEDIPADDLMSTEDASVAGVPGLASGGNNSIIMGGMGGSNNGGQGGAGSVFGGQPGGTVRLSGGFGEFVVGEEFDVGPMFVMRQKEEEERWRGLVERWVEGVGGGEEGWRVRRKGREGLKVLLEDPEVAREMVRR